MHAVPIVEPGKDAALRYWKAWFEEKGIKHEVRTIGGGQDLFRIMNDSEYQAFIGPGGRP